MSEGATAIRLVVNAEDFGLSEAISRGILKAHTDGIVTSTSVLGNVAQPQATAALLKQVPTLGVGAHLNVVSGAPVAAPSRVASLLGPDGCFAGSARAVFKLWAKNALDEDELEREWDAQIGQLRAVGLRLDHVNAHERIGFLPMAARIIERLAKRHHVPGMRTTVEAPNLAWFTDAGRGLPLAAVAGLAWLGRRSLGALKHGPQTWGYAESRRLDVVPILEILGRLGPGVHELLCHPSLAEAAQGLPQHDRDTAGQRELAALTSPLVREALRERRICLARWQDLF